MTKRLVEIDDLELERAREAGGFTTIKETVSAGLRQIAVTEARKREVIRLRSGYLAELADKEKRSAAWRMPDLLIAAIAERNRVTLIHYDADFDLIAEITGQAAEWVVAQGSVS